MDSRGRAARTRRKLVRHAAPDLPSVRGCSARSRHVGVCLARPAAHNLPGGMDSRAARHARRSSGRAPLRIASGEAISPARGVVDSQPHSPARSAENMARLCSSRFERAARKQGWTRIAGLDEAGRGALFGPVVAAAVILNPKRRIVGLDDSKQVAPERRALLAERIRQHALAWAVAEIDAQRIDAWNIYQASRQAMTAALQQLTITPDYLLIDAMQLDVLIEQKPLIKGDCRSVSIAAASILAKTHRDARMEEWDAVYPQYGLARHKGYATADHLEALRQHGPSPLHRHSFAPVRESNCWAVGATQISFLKDIESPEGAAGLAIVPLQNA